MATKPSALNVSELRSTLAPLLKAFQGLSAVGDMLEQVVLEETRLRGLAKDRDELEQAVATLRTSCQSVEAEIASARQGLQAARDEHKATQARVKAQSDEMAQAASAHASRLQAEREAHQTQLKNERTQHDAALGAVKDEHAKVLRQLDAAKGKLAEFHQKLQTLTAA